MVRRMSTGEPTKTPLWKKLLLLSVRMEEHTCARYMISKGQLTAGAEEVIRHGDLGISRRNALGLQSVADAFIPLPGRKERWDFSFGKQRERRWLQTHIIAKFSVGFLFLHPAAYLGQEVKFFKMGPQQRFLCMHKRRERRVRQALPPLAGGSHTSV